MKDEDWFEIERRREEEESNTIIPLERAATGFVHLVGEPVDGVQQCLTCGGWIVDNRNVVLRKGELPRFFPPGQVTIVQESLGYRATSGARDDVPECQQTFRL